MTRATEETNRRMLRARTAYRKTGSITAAPTCFTMAWSRPSSFGEAADG